jgi:hypothetical protein
VVTRREIWVRGDGEGGVNHVAQGDGIFVGQHTGASSILIADYTSGQVPLYRL